MNELSTDGLAVRRAFSKQAAGYDAADRANPILGIWRERVYRHIDRFLQPHSDILELNAGTGIDALRLAQAGHHVLATDVSPGMVLQLQQKVLDPSASGRLSAQACSYENLEKLPDHQYDQVFSNFGGLNCCADLGLVIRQLPRLLKPGSRITWVIMPPICPWEWLWLFRGSFSAFRRLSRHGTKAHLEGEYFMTYYYSLKQLQQQFGPGFKLLHVEGLGAVSPPPASYRFVRRFPRITKWLNKLDERIGGMYPFSHWADHIIVTFEYMP
ncbi:MAG TPA: methyltransferase domain-containing protein [Cyclobacteriaceae bacterium]|nr:methyltransferase domain-containing protein [Cyclobacteriaceae bacterium]